MKVSTFIFIIALFFVLLFDNPVWAVCTSPLGTDYRCTGCETIGYKSNGRNSLGQNVCIDRQCVDALNGSTQCNRCAQGYYLSDSKSACFSCPVGFVCDGITKGCTDGAFFNGSSCQSCDASCRTCSGNSNSQCTSCPGGQLLSNGKCLSCPENAVCDGSSVFGCKEGYVYTEGKCLQSTQEPAQTNTVSSCPSHMTLSSDGCCCINK